ncbi:MAG: DRTGG domain-containing protein [Oscillospiraceae bacterium]|nr:DRTGG domain-containing protein [Oscillospiraceae bacterium]
MTVSQLADALNLEALCGSAETMDAAVAGGYCGDLLSWVMGRAPEGAAWLTIMSNPNVAAVASLGSLSCVILTEGVRPDTQLLQRMISEDIPLLRSGEETFKLAGKIYKLLYA